MSERTAVVTGAAAGIGKATSDLFRERGWNVVGVDREWLAGMPANAVALDLADGEAWDEFVRDLESVDALVNNAAINRQAQLQDFDLGDWREVMAVNLDAAAIATARLAGPLAASGGAIVNVASVHALGTTEGMTAYASSKAALAGLTRASAVELGPTGVRVNAVLPGAVETAMLLPGVAREARTVAIDRLRERTPLRRIGSPADIAEAVLFLADPASSSFITGQCLVADGGATARLATE